MIIDDKKYNLEFKTAYDILNEQSNLVICVCCSCGCNWTIFYNDLSPKVVRCPECESANIFTTNIRLELN